MKKLKIYLDTSVISHLFADDASEKMSDTLNLWAEIMSGKFEVLLSDVTIEELNQCSEPKLSNMMRKLNEINFSIASVDEPVKGLAEQYVANEVLRPKSFDDCLHIACAVINNCDLLVSWNFKHLVNFKTIKGVRIVNSLNNYGEIGILSPPMLIEWEE